MLPGIFTPQRPRYWDTFRFVRIEADELPDEFDFIHLPDNSLVSSVASDLLLPFVEAIDKETGYRAKAIRHGPIYTLATRDIHALSADIEGEYLSATSIAGRQEARVDGLSSLRALTEFLPLAPKGDWSLEAKRLNDRFWEFDFCLL